MTGTGQSSNGERRGCMCHNAPATAGCHVKQISCLAIAGQNGRPLAASREFHQIVGTIGQPVSHTEAIKIRRRNIAREVAGQFKADRLQSLAQ